MMEEDFDELINQVTNPLSESKCQRCDGTGEVPSKIGYITCPECNGKALPEPDQAIRAKQMRQGMATKECIELNHQINEAKCQTCSGTGEIYDTIATVDIDIASGTVNYRLVDKDGRLAIYRNNEPYILISKDGKTYDSESGTLLKMSPALKKALEHFKPYLTKKIEMSDRPGLDEAKKKTKNNPWAICTSSVGRDDKEKYERCVKKVKKQVGESMNDIDKIVNIMAEDEGMLGLTLDNPVDANAVPDNENTTSVEGNWVIMCHGEEDGKKETEVWGPYSSKDAAVADLKDCIKDEWGDDKLAEVESQLGNGHVEIDGWTKVIVQLKSPEAEESESEEETESPSPENIANDVSEEGAY